MQTVRETERILKVLANRRRLAILKLLDRRGSVRVGDIATDIKLSFKATSKHMGILSAAQMVEGEQAGLSIKYHLKGPVHRLVRLALDNF